MSAEDLTGREFGKLTVLSRAQNRITNAAVSKVVWLCECSCGTKKEILGDSLRSGGSRSCGCTAKELARRLNKSTVHIIDLAGQRIGRLSVISRAEKTNRGGDAFWLCECDCGNTKVISGASLRDDTTLSCTCLQRELSAERGRLKRGLYAGAKASGWKGGVTPQNELVRKSAAYKAWRKAVFERDDYTCQMCGKRGVTVNADHIKPFALFPELRLDLGNGRTLCEPCHRKTPTYGVNQKEVRTCGQSS